MKPKSKGPTKKTSKANKTKNRPSSDSSSSGCDGSFVSGGLFGGAPIYFGGIDEREFEVDPNENRCVMNMFPIFSFNFF